MEYFTTDGIKIAYEISGLSDGPKLILLHGLYINSDCWREQLPVFEKDFCVLKFDLRGHGRSTKPLKELTIQDYVNDLAKLLDSLDWTENLFFVGHSLGVLIALVYALKHQSRVKKMVVSGNYCSVDDEAVNEIVDALETYPLFQFGLGIGWNGLNPYNKETSKFIAKMVADHMTKEDCLNATLGVQGFDICQDLKMLTIPTLIIAGENDLAVPQWKSEHLHKLLPQSELIIIPGAKHLTIFSHAEAFNKHVMEFLTRH
ncbi:MAG: alpha/beta fold hydrolase [Promethearchaeota archaeon]